MNRIAVAGIVWSTFFCLLPSQTVAADIEPGLYLRSLYAGGHLSLNTVYIATRNKIVIDPTNGIDPFDIEAAAKANPASVGTFKINGAKIAVTWGNGKSESLDIEFDKGAFSALDGGLISKAESYKKNQTLNATFAGSARTTNVLSSRTISFTEDGKFTMTLFGGIRGVPANSGMAEKTIHGTYKLSGNTLVLTSSSGEVSKHTVLPFNTALDPKKAKISDDHMILDGSNMKREK